MQFKYDYYAIGKNNEYYLTGEFMKKLAKVFLCVASLGLLLTGCDNSSSSGSQQPSDPGQTEPTTVKVTGVTLNKTEVTLKVGETDTLIATVAPENATNKEVRWSSSNSSVVSVEDGVLTAKNAGETDVYVATKDGNYTAKAHVVVTDDEPVEGEVKVSSVSLNKSSLSLKVGGSETLVATVLPANATNKNVTWSSSNENVASVANGVVTALSAGEASITVTTEDGNKTATAIVTVKDDTAPVDDPVAVTSVSLNKSSLSLKVGGSETLVATVLPANATNKNVTWSSSNENVASVANGVVTALSAGEASITVTTEDGNKTATAIVTVKDDTAPVDDPVAVTSVSLNKSSLSLKVGGTETLTATVLPSNATNKNVTWSSSDTTVATVVNGKVTAKAAGQADITVKTEDGNKTATARVTVTESSDPVTPSEETLTYTFSSKSWAASPKNWTSLKDGYSYDSTKKGVQVTTGSTDASAKSPEEYDAVKKVVISYCTNASKGAGSISVYVGDTLVGEQSVTKDGGTTLRDLTFNVSDELSGYVKFVVECTTNSIYVNKITIEHGEAVPTDPTSISIGDNFNIVNGKTKQLSVTYTPSNANQNKDVTWSISDANVATVSSSGLVTASSTASIGSTATITATLKFDTSIKASCVLTIAEEVPDSYTLLFYVCGADLESDGGNATADIKEILSVSGQPDDVNIVLETGGASKWNSTYPIKSNELGRWHVENKSLVKDGSVAKASMGQSSTLQSFLEWGIENYPAEKYGLFMWNHGGAMDGCCFDENYDNDSLSNSEIYTAVKNARKTCGLTKNLEFIAYDACLMGVQDIAEYNSLNFNYMLSSQESEYATGYDYDAWLPTLYNNPSVDTVTLLSKVADTFIAEQNKNRCYDQTQAVYDLSKMAAYKDAWEEMAEGFAGIVTKSNWNTFKTAVNKAQKYGQYFDENGDTITQYNNGYMYDIFDVVGALTELKKVSAYSSLSSKIQAVLDAHDEVVVHEIHGTDMSGSHGMCLFCPISGYNLYEPFDTTDDYGDPVTYPANYAAEDTNFTTWRDFVVACGTWYN